jgi:hypothetical protein
MVRGFAGVPSKLTRPLIVPFCGGLADDSVMTVKTAAIVTITFVGCMETILLTFFKLPCRIGSKSLLLDS